MTNTAECIYQSCLPRHKWQLLDPLEKWLCYSYNLSLTCCIYWKTNLSNGCQDRFHMSIITAEWNEREREAERHYVWAAYTPMLQFKYNAYYHWTFKDQKLWEIAALYPWPCAAGWQFNLTCFALAFRQVTNERQNVNKSEDKFNKHRYISAGRERSLNDLMSVTKQCTVASTVSRSQLSTYRSFTSDSPPLAWIDWKRECRLKGCWSYLLVEIHVVKSKQRTKERRKNWRLVYFLLLYYKSIGIIKCWWNDNCAYMIQNPYFLHDIKICSVCKLKKKKKQKANKQGKEELLAKEK